MSSSLATVARDARGCRICVEHLPLGPRPVFRVSATARLLIIGQAPGTKVHETGIPWNDASGERLRDWLRLDCQHFYDESRVAIVPMGFCYPGTDTRGGDRPPRKECAPSWHPALLALMPEIRLTLLVGSYAQARYLGAARKSSLTETVRAFRDFAPRTVPLPHPSWRNTGWLKRHPWFETDLLPYLRRRVAATLE